MLQLTYFEVLLYFIGPPLLILTIIMWPHLNKHGYRLGPLTFTPAITLMIHVLMAVGYTTPWDNYLVATRVWWYDPDFVVGLTIGWVPIEEYTFFIVQTLMTGLFTLWLLRRFHPTDIPLERIPGANDIGLRLAVFSLTAMLWLFSTIMLFSGWQPATYLTLILSWVMIPFMLQFIFGADILLAHWRVLLVGIGLPTLYLWVVDYIAIHGGTWIISPDQTLGLKLGVLPIEEMTFFLVTNMLIVLGVTLFSVKASHERALQWLAALGQLRKRDSNHAASTD